MKFRNKNFKQKLVRNELLYEGKSTGLFDFPIIKKQKIDIDKITLLSYVEKDFKFFNYADSYEKNNIKPCDVCGKVVAVNQFGYGNCKNCGWCQDPSRIKFPDKVQYPNLLSLNKAKKLYKEGKEIKPDLDDFLDGLFMYSEMEFFYENKKFGVVIEDGAINIFEDGNFNNVQIFRTKADFKSKAKVNGALLKDVWCKVTKVNYMQG